MTEMVLCFCQRKRCYVFVGVCSESLDIRRLQDVAGTENLWSNTDTMDLRGLQNRPAASPRGELREVNNPSSPVPREAGRGRIWLNFDDKVDYRWLININYDM